MKICKKTIFEILFGFGIALVGHNCAYALIPTIDASAIAEGVTSNIEKVKQSKVIMDATALTGKINATIGSAKASISELGIEEAQKAAEKLKKEKENLEEAKEKYEEYKKELEEKKKAIEEAKAEAEKYKNEASSALNEAKSAVNDAKSAVNEAQSAVNEVKNETQKYQNEISSTVNDVKTQSSSVLPEQTISTSNKITTNNSYVPNNSYSAISNNSYSTGVSSAQNNNNSAIISQNNTPQYTAAGIKSDSQNGNLPGMTNLNNGQNTVFSVSTPKTITTLPSNQNRIENTVMTSQQSRNGNNISYQNSNTSLMPQINMNANKTSASDELSNDMIVTEFRKGTDGTGEQSQSTNEKQENLLSPTGYDRANILQSSAISAVATTKEGETENEDKISIEQDADSKSVFENSGKAEISEEGIILQDSSNKGQINLTPTTAPEAKINKGFRKRPNVNVNESFFEKRSFNNNIAKVYAESALRNDILSFAQLSEDDLLLNSPTGKNAQTDEFIFSDKLARYCSINVNNLEEEQMQECLKNLIRYRSDSNSQVAAEGNSLYTEIMQDTVSAMTAEGMKAKNDSTNYSKDVLAPMQKDLAASDTIRNDINSLSQANKQIQILLNEIIKIYSSQLTSEAMGNLSKYNSKYVASPEDGQ